MRLLLVALGFTIVSGGFPNEDHELYTYAHPGFNDYLTDEISQYEIIDFPGYLTLIDTEISDIELKIFGNIVNLKLRRNDHLISPNFKAHIKDEVNGDKELNLTASRCHYLHKDESSIAAISFCQNKEAQGILFLPNETFEIQPLFPRELNKNLKKNLHVVRKIPYSPQTLANDVSKVELPFNINQQHKTKRDQGGKKKITIEAALFFDEAAYKLFGPYFKYKEEEMTDMLLAYVNAIQALYHHPSLKQAIDIVLVKMEIFKRQPSDLPHYGGERTQLLDSFCAYNQKHNPKGDENPNHWDMGLYVSGLDFFAYENGKKSGVTMGLATVGGVCMDKYNCVIAELGTTNVFGKPYPSAGFTSVYILAHEIGHNLGMHHDSTGNNCPKEGYIMSPSRGTNGETLWSPCSASVVNSMEWAKCLEDSPSKPPKNLDHRKYENLPGIIWGAKRQCEILLRDSDAEIYSNSKLEGICENLQCKTPHRSGFYFAGPALEGTTCGENKWCQGGSCVNIKKNTKQKVIKGGWSNWTTVKECSSECIQKSRGYLERQRTCTNPKPVNTNDGCEGSGFEVLLCKDDKLCKGKRHTIKEYAAKKCKQFSKWLPALDQNASGLQATYESGRLWMSCAIFCKRKNSNSYYTPRFELNDMNIDPYFPDGTWCHNDGKINYYCVQHHCLPENFKFTKGLLPSDDLLISQNAHARQHTTSDDILKYFSIDSNKNPLLQILHYKPEIPEDDDEWLDNDYIEIPELNI